MSGRLVSIAAIAVIGVSPRALAAPDIAPDIDVVELRYDAPTGCPARGEIEAAIHARTDQVRFGAPGRRVVAIRIQSTAGGFRGTLGVDRADAKELAAPRCDDLASAFALIAALALARSERGDGAPNGSDGGAESSAPPGIAPAASAPPRAARPPGDPRARRIEATLAGMVDAGVGPTAMFGAAAQAALVSDGAYQLELAAVIGRDRRSEASGGRDAEARFTWLALRPAACLHGRWRSLGVAGCGHAEIGAVRASGTDIVNQRGATRLWLAGGVHSGAALTLGHQVFTQLQLGVSLPVVRDRYLFAPAIAIHDTPTVTSWMTLGLGVQFR